MSALPQSAEPCFAPLGEADFARVLPIEQMAYSHPWTQGNFRDALVAGYHLEGLWQDGELLGYFVAMRGVDEVHLLNLTVAPDHQRQGHARRMLERLQIWTTAQGLRCVGLEVRASNARAQAVYQAYGFGQVGLRKDYYPLRGAQREHAVVMTLTW